MKVFKYEIEPAEYVTIDMPEDAIVLTVDMQYGKVCMWALVDPTRPTSARVFRWAGTGHEIREPLERLNYINTFQMSGGALIFHLFEVV